MRIIRICPNIRLTYSSVRRGATSSGKSSLLAALLGELDLLSGTLEVDKSSFGLCAQSPWLQQQSIRNNITFLTPYNEDRYNKVVAACALLPDFELFDDGDLTEIGERGVTLSGGTKARVALARAAYCELIELKVSLLCLISILLQLMPKWCY